MPLALGQARTPLFGLRPSLYGKTTLEKNHFQYAVKAGSKVQDAVEVLNFTNRQLALKLYAGDLLQAPDGSLTPADQTQTMQSVGAWLSLERDSITLPPQGKGYVSFILSVPPGVRPGDHLGAVVASTTTPAAPGSQLSVESRVALITRVRIPGTPHLAATIGTLRVSQHGRRRTFTVEVRNTGNLLFTAKGTVDVTSGDRRVSSLMLSPPEVYLIPDGRATFQVTWSPPYFGNRRATAAFDTRSPGEPFRRISSRSVAFHFFSWAPIIAALVVALVLALVVLVSARRRAGAFTEPDTPVPSPGARLLP